jgi:hypothetical protein
MKSQKIGKILISIAVVLSAIVSTIVDLLPGESGHVHNPTWNPHAVFHDIVMFLLLDFMAVVCLWLLWRKSLEPQIGVKVATLLVLGFWTPFYYVTTLFPEASLAAANPTTDPVAYANELNAVTFMVGGIRVYFNVVIGTVMVLIALMGYYLYNKGSKASAVNA